MQHHGARLQAAQQVLDLDRAAGVQPCGGFVIRTKTELTRREMLV